MSRLKDITLSWKGKDYIVKSRNVMELIDEIEEVVTIDELSSGKLKRAKISKAFSAALNFAGAKNIAPEDIYVELFGSDAMASTVGAVQSLLTLMIPPEHLQTKAVQPKKPRARTKSKG